MGRRNLLGPSVGHRKGFLAQTTCPWRRLLAFVCKSLRDSSNVSSHLMKKRLSSFFKFCNAPIKPRFHLKGLGNYDENLVKSPMSSSFSLVVMAYRLLEQEDVVGFGAIAFAIVIFFFFFFADPTIA